MKKDIILAGVGGQGILTIATILGAAALNRGWHLKQAEVHGMSQRGGDVVSTVRFGAEVFSPLPAVGETDYILAFEKLEALRQARFLAPRGIVLVNDFVWKPLPVAAGFEAYPEDVVERLKQRAGELVVIPATDIATRLGNEKASNVVLIGLLASRMKIAKETWLEVLRRKVPARFLDLNLKAFEAGFGFRA